MEKISEYIEHTLLRANAGVGEVEKLVQEALENKILGVCLAPYWVKKARRDIGRQALVLVTVAGFPLGYERTESKLKSIDLALKDGADEIDVVMNLSAFASGAYHWVKSDLAQCSKLVHENEKILKVIIETAYLNTQEITLACQIAQDAGADFVKTSTGFATRGASTQDIQIMRAALSPSVGIKASGGIKDYEQALQLIRAGAERIGTSAGVLICQQAQLLNA